MEFFDWSILLTLTGAVLAVAILTQITKGIPGIRRLPTQLWSYILAVVVQTLAHYFTGDLNLAAAALVLINSALVSLAANGGYSAIDRIKQSLTDNTNHT